MTFATFDNIRDAFAFLTSSLRSQLVKADICDIKRVLIEQRESPDAVQLPQELVEKIKSSSDIDALFNDLTESDYWNWMDVRLLSVMAAATQNMENVRLLANYKKSVYSKRLFDVMPNIPSINVKQEYYRKIVTKINKDVNLTVGDLIDFKADLEKVILDIKNGTCTLDHLEKGCIEAHWYIPTHCVDDAYKSAGMNRHKFDFLDLKYIHIGDYPIICDPQENQDANLITTSPGNDSLIAMKIRPFTVVYTYIDLFVLIACTNTGSINNAPLSKKLF